MNVILYYRGFNRKLHALKDVVGEDETICKVLSETDEYLKGESITYSAPILALIQGGKA